MVSGSEHVGRKAQEGAMREGCGLTIRSPDRSESAVYEFSGQLIHEKLSATCKGTATQGSGSPKAGSDKRIAPVAGAGLTGRRSVAVPGARVEPARWAADWRRFRPSETTAHSATGPGGGGCHHGCLSLRLSVGAGPHRRSPTNVARWKISSSDSSCPEHDFQSSNPGTV